MSDLWEAGALRRVWVDAFGDEARASVGGSASGVIGALARIGRVGQPRIAYLVLDISQRALLQLGSDSLLVNGSGFMAGDGVTLAVDGTVERPSCRLSA